MNITIKNILYYQHFVKSVTDDVALKDIKVLYSILTN